VLLCLGDLAVVGCLVVCDLFVWVYLYSVWYVSYCFGVVLLIVLRVMDSVLCVL